MGDFSIMTKTKVATPGLCKGASVHTCMNSALTNWKNAWIEHLLNEIWKKLGKDLKLSGWIDRRERVSDIYTNNLQRNEEIGLKREFNYEWYL